MARTTFRIQVLLLAALVTHAGCAAPERPPRSRGGASSHDRGGQAPGHDYRLPGEFEPVTDVLLVWHDAHAVFLADVIAEVRDQARVTILAPPDSDRGDIEQELVAAAVDPSHVEVFETPVDSIWIRDFGPKTVLRRQGPARLLDLGYRERETDDRLPVALARSLWQRSIVRVPLTLDGGNLMSDGQGTCLTTTAGVMESNVEPNTFRERLRKYLGCTETIVLPELEDEPTGHVDMMVTITGPRQAIVAEADVGAPPEIVEELDWTAILLEDEGFVVRRVRMPDPSDGVFRSYTNAVAVNGVVLVPAYPEFPEHDAEALEVFAEAYPGREIVAIDSSGLIELDGAIHCATQTLTMAWED
jgi:agmatine/peptidylarginine deiminase